MTQSQRGPALTPDHGGQRRSDRVLRAGLYSLLAAMLAVAASGIAERGDARVTGWGVGTELVVIHPAVTRGGLPFHLSIGLQSDEPLPVQVTLAVEASYLAAIDVDSVIPAPGRETRSENLVHWTFDVHPGASELWVDVDGRVEPGEIGRLAAVIETEIDGRDVPPIRYSTVILP